MQHYTKPVRCTYIRSRFFALKNRAVSYISACTTMRGNTVRCYKLTHVPEKKFKNKSKLFIPSYFVTQWKNKLLNEDISRLATYKLINDDFSFPKHLGLPHHLRKVISRTRCSNHPLEIEKGRHKNPKTPRQERLCKLCYDQVVEDEDHFLLRCTTYSHLRGPLPNKPG